MSLVAKTREKFRHGLVLQWLSDRLLSVGLEFTPFYWVQEYCGQSLLEGLDAREFAEFSFEELGPDDMERAAAISGGEFVTIDEVRRSAAAPGVKCFALKHNQEIACSTWFNLHECNSYLRPMPLKENEAYLYGMYTQRAYRGRNLAPYLRYRAVNELKSLGKDTFYSISVCFNRPSINFKKKLGAKFLELHLRVMLFKKFGFTRRIRTYSTRPPRDNGADGRIWIRQH
jgi:GNAT superfamily N-acetyltransferase